MVLILNDSKYIWVIPLKDKKSFTITKALQTILDKYGPKSDKIW